MSKLIRAIEEHDAALNAWDRAKTDSGRARCSAAAKETFYRFGAILLRAEDLTDGERAKLTDFLARREK